MADDLPASKYFNKLQQWYSYAQNNYWTKADELEKQLEVLLLPKDPNDSKDIIVEIRAGAGGDEASLFAGDLYRMYVQAKRDGIDYNYIAAQPVLGGELSFNGHVRSLSRIAGLNSASPQQYLAGADSTHLVTDVNWRRKLIDPRRASLQMRRELLGTEHPDVASGAANLAYWLIDAKELDEAEILVNESLATRRKMLGPEHPTVATTLTVRANLHLARSRYREAADDATEAERILDVWLETPFDGGRHQRRIDQILDAERQSQG